MGALDILLQAEIPSPQTRQFKQKRLSELFGEDVVFTLKELGFSRVAEIKKLGGEEETEIGILLAGVVEPDLKNKDLLAKYNAVTPAELVKKLLLPGEIMEISQQIERLSGYRQKTLEEIKKN